MPILWLDIYHLFTMCDRGNIWYVVNPPPFNQTCKLSYTKNDDSTAWHQSSFIP